MLQPQADEYVHVPARCDLTERRKIMLRSERRERDSRNLWAYLDGDGSLHIDGQDLGPGTAPISSDGEYEWFQKIRAEHIPRSLEVLGAPPESDILSFLDENYSGESSYVLERLLRTGDVPVEFSSWSG